MEWRGGNYWLTSSKSTKLVFDKRVNEMAKKGETEREGARQDQQESSKSIKDVDLMGDVATIVGTAIGIVGGAAGFVGSKVAEAISGKSEKKPAAKKAGTKKASKKTASKVSGRKSNAVKKASGKKASAAGKGGGKKTASRKK